MTTYMFKSFPANRSCNINLAEIEKQYHIFTTAVDKCNAGTVSYTHLTLPTNSRV